MLPVVLRLSLLLGACVLPATAVMSRLTSVRHINDPAGNLDIFIDTITGADSVVPVGDD